MFYFIHVVIVFYNLLLYAGFRGGIYDYLRLSKMSKTNIKKNRKGFKNYWLYQSVNELTPLGILYYLNIIFLIFTALFSVLTIAFGYIRLLQPVFLILSITLCMIEIPATMLAGIYNYKAEFGRPFVLFARRNDTNKFCSSIIDIFSWCVTAFFICLAYQQL